MKLDSIASDEAHNLNTGYAQCAALTDVQKIAFVSGQIPLRPDGSLPVSFAEQADQAWANVKAQLEAAGMGMDNIVKHTTYLSDRKYKVENRAARLKALGDHAPALTVVIAGIFDDDWLLEVEAVAAS